MNKSPDRSASERSIKRGLDFIYRLANTPEGFDSYGTFLICCFALVGATSRDSNLRRLMRARAQKLSYRWSREHRLVPLDASPDLVMSFVFVRYALGRLGVRDRGLNSQLRLAAKRFSAQDLPGFDPVSEPPAADLSYRCDCGFQNQRGRTFCKQCRRRLEIRSHHRVWMDALTRTYVSERCRISLGARYPEVLRWLPAMRPYPSGAEDNVELLRDALYAVTHIVYTLNDYGTYRLRPGWLPREFAFLKSNVAAACERNDPELLGELLDSLRAFGLSAGHSLIIGGTEYLLAEQNADGSWGDPEEENIRTRCHTTWTAIDGLR